MSKKKRKRNEHRHEDFIFIGINGTTGKFQKLTNQDKSNEDFLSFLNCLDGRAEQSTIPVEKGSGKYPYVNFKKNIADDFKQQFEKHKQRKKIIPVGYSFGARALSLMGGDDIVNVAAYVFLSPPPTPSRKPSEKVREEDDQNWERSFKQVSTPCLYICGEKCDKKLRKAHAEKKLMNINPKSKVVEIKSCDSIFRPVIDGATKANVQEEIASEINQWVETL